MISGKSEKVTIVAGADLTGAASLHKIITVAGVVAATNANALGSLVSSPNSGQHGSVAYQGHIKAYAGAAVSQGVPLKVTTSGYLITVTSGNLVAPIGKSLRAANSGDLFDAVVNFANGAINL